MTTFVQFFSDHLSAIALVAYLLICAGLVYDMYQKGQQRLTEPRKRVRRETSDIARFKRVFQTVKATGLVNWDFRTYSDQLSLVIIIENSADTSLVVFIEFSSDGKAVSLTLGKGSKSRSFGHTEPELWTVTHEVTNYLNSHRFNTTL